MAGLEVRAFNAPDESRRPDKTQVDVVKMGANTAARLTLEPGWKSRDFTSPVVSAILNDVVFAVATGLPSGGATTPVNDRIKRATGAVLVAIDARTGKELWTSGKTITSFNPSIPPSVGDSQVYVVTHDGLLYAFGLPLEH